MTERVLVTGGAGFVGQALCRQLLDDGHAVRAAVRAVDERTAQLAEAGVEIAEVGDVANQPRWQPALEGVSAVIDAAGRAHVLRDTAGDPAEAYRQVNVIGSTTLARAMVDQGVRRLSFVSSIKVNGEETTDAPHRPDDAPNPQDDYGRSKLEAEQELTRIARSSDMSLAIIRPPLVYGPGVKANFAKLVGAVRRGIPLPLGGIHNQRSLIAVSNLVTFLSQSIRQEWDARIFLVSDQDDVSTPELCRRIGKALKRPARLLPVPAWLLRLGASALGRAGVARRLCGSLVVDSSSSWEAMNATPVATMAEELERIAQHASAS